MEKQNQLKNKTKPTKEYYCSKHGGEYNLDCLECWRKFKKFCKKNKIKLIGDVLK